MKYRKGQKLSVIVESIDENGKPHLRVVKEEVDSEKTYKVRLIKTVSYDTEVDAESLEALDDYLTDSDIWDLIDEDGDVDFNYNIIE